MKLASILLTFLFIATSCNQEKNNVNTTVTKIEKDSIIIQAPTSSSIVETDFERFRKLVDEHYPKTISLDNQIEINLSYEIDSTIKLNHDGLGLNVFFEKTKKVNGETEVLKSRTNWLELICDTYYRVSRVDKRNQILKSCNDVIEGVIISEESEKYFLTFITDTSRIRKEIVSIYVNLESWDFEEYNDGYFQLWLRNPETGNINTRFLAVGGSSIPNILEFHFSEEDKEYGYWYTSIRNALNGNIPIEKDTCK